MPRVLDRMVRLRAPQAWLLVLLCIDAAASLDYLTGPELWFGPVYLLVICIAAWALGWWGGQLTGLGCMSLTFALNGASLYPHGDAAFAWNFGMRYIAVSLIVLVVAGARRAFVREWWLARTDLLTGALNRQAFFELAPSVNAERWRLLVYADLDGLKKVNDVQGHAAGDACLRAFGAAVRRMIRRNDIFARAGGDEFLIFMSVNDEAAAGKAAARLHKAMNEVRTENGAVRCSVGGLVVPPGDMSLDGLVRSADELMYAAKIRGACLQMGVAPQAEQPASGRARKHPRPSVERRPVKKRLTERRAQATEGFAREGVPRYL